MSRRRWLHLPRSAGEKPPECRPPLPGSLGEQPPARAGGSVLFRGSCPATGGCRVASWPAPFFPRLGSPRELVPCLQASPHLPTPHSPRQEVFQVSLVGTLQAGRQ